MILFDNPSDMMCKSVAKKYEDPKALQNQFYLMVTSKIDESLFQPLFKEGWMGAQNASIRMLVAMSVMKEGFGCSDEELMKKVQFLDCEEAYFRESGIRFHHWAIRFARKTCLLKIVF